MKDTLNTKKWGLGSFSFLISIFAIMFSFTYINGKYLGQYIFNTLEISFPYELTSLILLVIAIILSSKYSEDKFAKAGKILSQVVISLILISALLTALL
ncbi:hypothetical protein [Clostridium sp. LIBA-8841]|uniref:hypothetical protein n=1 Tax=Clostridium sp. LIBA-8841 TaxID=2987530 RepID=UPI002AC74872|nr:hypothetical protein [Clostridium sp. LIBA-8841]MDZ5253832.1 hypothetical protein [Clostridium sp. LIBA-8841]